MRILLACGKYQYGKEDLGLGTEYNAFLPALINLGHEVDHFEIWDRSKYKDFSEMNKDLYNVAYLEKPDVIIFVILHFEIWIETLSAIRDLGIATVCWTTDDSWKYDVVTKYIGRYFSLVTTTYFNVLSKYKRDGIHQVFLTQWAASSTTLLPPVAAKDCKYSVTFVGASHGDRKKRVELLRKQGILVTCFGRGWESGAINANEIPIIMQNSIISLNFANSKGENQLKARTFEVPGAGGFLLTDYVENLESFFVIDEEIVVAENNIQMIDKITYYLKNLNERDRISQAGYLKTKTEHTYEQRLSQVLEKALEERGKYVAEKLSSRDNIQKAYKLHVMDNKLKLLKWLMVGMCNLIWGRGRGTRAARQIAFYISRTFFGSYAFSSRGIAGRMFYKES